MDAENLAQELVEMFQLELCLKVSSVVCGFHLSLMLFILISCATF